MAKKQVTKKRISGSNVDRPVFQSQQGGQSYDELKKIYQETEKTGQTYVDPDSLGAWAIKKGYTPNFLSKERARQYITPGSPVYTTLTSQEKKNFESYIARSEPVDPFVTGEKPLPPGFKLATEPKSGKTIPIPETHTFDAKGNLVPIAAGATPSGLSPEAKTLAKTMLLRDETTNLGTNPVWQPAPDDVKKQAYQELQRITSSPEAMADFAIENEIQNLQKYSWWNTSPNKQQAWSLIQQRQAEGTGIGKTGGITGTQAPAAPAAPATPTTPGTPAAPTTPTAPTTPEGVSPSLQTAYDIIDKAVADGIITPDQAALFKSATETWEPGKEVNIQNVIDEFNKIKSKTIDPHFQELTNLAISDIERAKAFQDKQRAIELEAERASAGQSIRQAKEGLEKAGMTFTGKAIETLGAESAYALPGAQGVATPFQQPFALDATQAFFNEGLVPQANRLIATSSEARFKRNLEALGQQAERQLGSGQASLFNLPGFGVTGGITGELPQAREQQLGSTLTDLYRQEQQNVLARNL